MPHHNAILAAAAISEISGIEGEVMSLFNHKLFLDELWKHSMRLNIRELAIATGLPTGRARKIRLGQVPDLESFLVLCRWMGVSPGLFMVEVSKTSEVREHIAYASQNDE